MINLNKILISVAILFSCTISSQAQLLIDYINSPVTVPSNSKFCYPVNVSSSSSISSPPSAPGSSVGVRGTPMPYEIIWLEYGDGRFTTNATNNHQFISNGSNLFDIICKGTPIYGGGGHPPVGKMQQTVNPSTGNILLSEKNNTIDPDLVSNGQVLITPNVRDIVPGDTMMFAISYKLLENLTNNYYLSFAYNQDANGQVFQILNISDQINFQNLNIGSSSFAVNQVRTHNGESYGTYSSIATATPTAGDRLLWKIDNKDIYEHNVFVTLKVLTTLSAGSNISAIFNAQLISQTQKGKTDVINTISSSDLELPLSYNLASHDPNYEIVNPNCLLFTEKPTATLKYHIHFQNTGPGPANDVKLKTALPHSLRLTDIANIKAKIGGNFITSSSDYNFIASQDISSDSVIFTFTKKSSATEILLGTATAPNAATNVKTMGDVFFEINTNSSMPNLLLSRTSIYFDTNEAVLTEECRAEFKECCSCACKPKKCEDKRKSKLWKWLFCKKC